MVRELFPVILMMTGAIFILAGYYVSRKYNKKIQQDPGFLPAAFINRRGIIIYLSLIVKIIGIVFVVTGIMLKYA